MTEQYAIRRDEEEAPPAAQPSQAPEARQSGYHNRTGTTRDGARVVWQEPASGRGGRFVRISPATADPASRETLENEQALLSRLRDTSRLAESFIEHNRESGTGGAGQSPWFPAWRAPHRQAIQGLSAEMVRSNIRPGMATTMNSDAEQMMAMRTYPSQEAGGDVNAERAVRVLVNRDVQVELINRMEQWLTRNPSLTGFQEEWRRVEPELRREITAAHVSNFGGRGWNFPNLNDRGNYAPGAGRGRTQDGGERRTQSAFDLRLDEATGEYHMVRRGQ